MKGKKVFADSMYLDEAIENLCQESRIKNGK